MNIAFIYCLVFAGVSLALHARRLPPQNLFAVALLIFGSATAAEWCARVLGFPFTPLLWEENFWCLPMVWIGVILTSRKIAQLFFDSRRGTGNYGFWILGGTILFVAVLWVSLEAILSEIRVTNLIGRLLTSLAILLLIFPWLIEKRPRRHPAASLD